MSGRSFPCEDGGQIDIPQAMQAAASGAIPEAAMNPVLLMPDRDSTSKVLINGKEWKTIHAKDFAEHASTLRAEALSAYERLSRKFDVVIVEGFGSVAELNLWEHDFANLSLAEEINANCILVTSIEQGGVFASILGTLNLLPPQQRNLFSSFFINCFQGDTSLFRDGRKIMEELSGLQCMGIFPHSKEIHLPDDEGFIHASSYRSFFSARKKPDIAIVRLPNISNTTDFRLLRQADWLTRPSEKKYDSIILPGTRALFSDFTWLHSSGFAQWILNQHRNGTFVFGIGGGFQMMGELIEDPHGVEGAPRTIKGLELLPVRTILSEDRLTRAHYAKMSSGVYFDCYEVRSGETIPTRPVMPFAVVDHAINEGVLLPHTAGTCLHGALESELVIAELFGYPDYRQRSDQKSYDQLAKWLESNASPATLNKLLNEICPINHQNP